MTTGRRVRRAGTVVSRRGGVRRAGPMGGTARRSREPCGDTELPAASGGSSCAPQAAGAPASVRFALDLGGRGLGVGFFLRGAWTTTRWTPSSPACPACRSFVGWNAFAGLEAFAGCGRRRERRGRGSQRARAGTSGTRRGTDASRMGTFCRFRPPPNDTLKGDLDPTGSAAARKTRFRRGCRGRLAGAETLRIIPLGGLGEVGKNMTVFEYGGEIIVVDAGLRSRATSTSASTSSCPTSAISPIGRRRVRAVVLTHAHEDHVGALPYFLREVGVPRGLGDAPHARAREVEARRARPAPRVRAREIDPEGGGGRRSGRSGSSSSGWRIRSRTRSPIVLETAAGRIVCTRATTRSTTRPSTA